MITTEHDAASGLRRIVLRANASLTVREVHRILAVILLFMGMIGVFFTRLGAWPVLPFAGLEWLLLAICMKWTLARNAMQEVITLADGLLLLERGKVKPEQTYRFHCAWVALEWVRPDNRHHPNRLFLRSHGRSVEIGSFLTDSEREALAQELKKMLFDDRN